MQNVVRYSFRRTRRSYETQAQAQAQTQAPIRFSSEGRMKFDGGCPVPVDQWEKRDQVNTNEGKRKRKRKEKRKKDKNKEA